MWTLPPRDLAVLLHQLIEHGDGGARYYADMSQAIVFMAVHAPPGPPRTAARFLDRLDAGWLAPGASRRRPPGRACPPEPRPAKRALAAPEPARHPGRWPTATG